MHMNEEQVQLFDGGTAESHLAFLQVVEGIIHKKDLCTQFTDWEAKETSACEDLNLLQYKKQSLKEIEQRLSIQNVKVASFEHCDDKKMMPKMNIKLFCSSGINTS